LTILRAVPATMFAFKAIPDWVALLDHPRMTHFEEYQLPKGIQNLSLSVTYYHDAQVNDYSWEYQGPTEAASNAKLMAIACNESRGDFNVINDANIVDTTGHQYVYLHFSRSKALPSYESAPVVCAHNNYSIVLRRAQKLSILHVG